MSRHFTPEELSILNAAVAAEMAACGVLTAEEYEAGCEFFAASDAAEDTTTVWDAPETFVDHSCGLGSPTLEPNTTCEECFACRLRSDHLPSYNWQMFVDAFKHREALNLSVSEVMERFGPGLPEGYTFDPVQFAEQFEKSYLNPENYWDEMSFDDVMRSFGPKPPAPAPARRLVKKRASSARVSDAKKAKMDNTNSFALLVDKINTARAELKLITNRPVTPTGGLNADPHEFDQL